MQFQINLAVHEASDLEFVPPEFRPKTPATELPGTNPAATTTGVVQSGRKKLR